VFPPFPIDLSTDVLDDLRRRPGAPDRATHLTPVVLTHDIDSAEACSNWSRGSAARGSRRRVLDELLVHVPWRLDEGLVRELIGARP